MSGARPRVGAFLWAIDPLFLPRSRSFDVCYLAGEGTPDERWGKRFLDPRRMATYRVSPACAVPYPALDTESSLRDTDLTQVVRRERLDALLLTNRGTPFIRAWGRRHGVALIATGAAHQRRFEHKLRFSRFLDDHGFPQPPTTVWRVGRPLLPGRGPSVIQDPESANSEGTFFVRAPAGIHALVRRGVLRRGKDYLMRPLVQGTPLGITIVIEPGRIGLSAVRRQCFEGAGEAGPGRFTGIQWIASRALAAQSRRDIDRVFLRLGERLHAERFVGYASIDFVLDRAGRVHLLECNPRLGSATTQMWQRLELTGGVATAVSFVRACLKRQAWSPRPACVGLPASTFTGACYEMSAAPRAGGAVRIGRVPAVGRYRLEGRSTRFLTPDVRTVSEDPREFMFCCGASPGDTFRSPATIGFLYTNFPLYSSRGTLTAAGQMLVRDFSLTVRSDG